MHRLSAITPRFNFTIISDRILFVPVLQYMTSAVSVVSGSARGVKEVIQYIFLTAAEWDQWQGCEGLSYLMIPRLAIFMKLRSFKNPLDFTLRGPSHVPPKYTTNSSKYLWCSLDFIYHHPFSALSHYSLYLIPRKSTLSNRTWNNCFRNPMLISPNLIRPNLIRPNLIMKWIQIIWLVWS